MKLFAQLVTLLLLINFSINSMEKLGQPTPSLEEYIINLSDIEYIQNEALALEFVSKYQESEFSPEAIAYLNKIINQTSDNLTPHSRSNIPTNSANVIPIKAAETKISIKNPDILKSVFKPDNNVQASQHFELPVVSEEITLEQVINELSAGKSAKEIMLSAIENKQRFTTEANTLLIEHRSMPPKPIQNIDSANIENKNAEQDKILNAPHKGILRSIIDPAQAFIQQNPVLSLAIGAGVVVIGYVGKNIYDSSTSLSAEEKKENFFKRSKVATTRGFHKAFVQNPTNFVAYAAAYVKRS